MLFLILQNVFYVLIPETFKKILDELAGQNRWELLQGYMVDVLLYTAGLTLALYIMRNLIIGISRKIEYKLRKDIYHKLTSVDIKFYRDHETGDLSSRCTSDLSDVRLLLGPGIMYVPNSLTRIGFFIPVLATISSEILMYCGILVSFVIFMIIVVLPRIRPLFKGIMEMQGALSNYVWQTISGISTIKQFAMEKEEMERFADINKKYIAGRMKIAIVKDSLWPFFMLIFSLTSLVILYIGGRQVINGEMTIGELMQFVVMISMLTFPILSLGWVMTLIQQGISAMERINGILDYPDEISDKGEQLNGGFELNIENLGFAYKDSTETVLENISMTISPGEVVGVTGRVGCGKSTLVKLITRMEAPDKGDILINGKSINSIKPDELYKAVGVVAQDPFLFSKSVKDNISLGPGEMNYEEVVKSAEIAGVSEEIEALPDKYDQIIGERGLTLSGGQRQRVTIARGIYKEPSLLIMDDALSAVDSETEEKILKDLLSKNSNMSILFISHRISSLKAADRIYVLGKGEVCEEGTHDELLNRDGTYAKLAALQRMEGKDV